MTRPSVSYVTSTIEENLYAKTVPSMHYLASIVMIRNSQSTSCFELNKEETLAPVTTPKEPMEFSNAVASL